MENDKKHWIGAPKKLSGHSEYYQWISLKVPEGFLRKKKLGCANSKLVPSILHPLVAIMTCNVMYLVSGDGSKCLWWAEQVTRFLDDIMSPDTWDKMWISFRDHG